jgi:acetyl esterase/lipase
VTALLARDNSGPRLRFQLLYYPATGAGDDPPARRENADAPVLSTADAETFTRYYAGHLDGEPPWTLAPALADDLSGLPPAYIATAQFDPLRDEGEMYGELLARADVPVQVRLSVSCGEWSRRPSDRDDRGGHDRVGNAEDALQLVVQRDSGGRHSLGGDPAE